MPSFRARVAPVLLLPVGFAVGLAVPRRHEPPRASAASVVAASAWPATPFTAWLGVGSANVRRRPDPRAPEVGVLSRGDPLTVTACVPDCAARGAWALLGDAGAVRLALLQLDPVEDAATGRAASARFWYARVLPGGGLVYREPRDGARVIGRSRAGHDLAFRVDEPLRARGWLRRPDGGYMRLDGLHLHRPSPFAGEPHPRAPLAFVRRPIALDGTHRLARYDRLAVRGRLPDGRLAVEGGALPRGSVRIALARPRPAAIPPGARWVHVDLGEQVLTAYEGDALVYATLVSTGRSGNATAAGVFRVFEKAAHAAMHGQPDDPYFVDEVPLVMFFRAGMALHGTFWHDRFGERMSHGCVNLSLTDAAWLFDWAPPALPPGWHTIDPLEAGVPSLWVVIERRAPIALPTVRPRRERRARWRRGSTGGGADRGA